jgi:hypothetical protein
MRNNERKYGVGIEAEGFFVQSSDHKPVARIGNIPTSEWLMEILKKDFPQLVPHVSFEQASVMLELVSGVHSDGMKAIEQIFEYRREINRVLASVNTELVFKPVLEDYFEFVPATSDPNSRAQELIKRWGSTTEGQARLRDTAIASLQINDSRPYKGVERMSDRLELSRIINNIFSGKFDLLNSKYNGGILDSEGRSRMDILLDFLTEANADKFLRHGYKDSMMAPLPGQFRTVDQLQRWMMACCDVKKFKDVRPKDMHPVTVKIKMSDREGLPWVAETRTFDAVEGEIAMRQRAHANDYLLTEARHIYEADSNNR